MTSTLTLSLVELQSILSTSATARLKDVAPVFGFARVTADAGQLEAVSTDHHIVGRIQWAAHEVNAEASKSLLLDLVALKPFVAALKAATPRGVAQHPSVTVDVEDDGIHLVSVYGPATRLAVTTAGFPPVEKLFPADLDAEVPAGVEHLRIDVALVTKVAALRHPADAPKPSSGFEFLLQPFEHGKPRPFVMRRDVGATGSHLSRVEALVMPLLAVAK